MGKCREGQSEVPFAQASHKCGKCGARTTDQSRVCQPQPIAPRPSQNDADKQPS